MLPIDFAALISHPAVKGALVGAVAAARVDFAAFRAWQSFDDAAGYGWKTAAWRWIQGAVIGALVGAGLPV